MMHFIWCFFVCGSIRVSAYVIVWKNICVCVYVLITAVKLLS